MADNLTFRIAFEGVQKALADLKNLGPQGQKAFEQITNATKEADRQLLALNAVMGVASGKMQGLAGAAGSVGAALSGLGTIGLAAAAAIGAVTLGATAAIAATEELTLANNKLSASLQAAGNSTGLSKAQLESLADSIEKTTLLSGEAVREAEATLNRFGVVSGAAFEDTIRLAADLSTIMGGDVVGAAQKLAKAISDPEKALKLLKEAGVDVASSGLDELIQRLVKTGEVAKAQELVIESLQKKLTGLATAEAIGTGKLQKHFLSESLQDLFIEIDKSFGITSRWVGALESAAGIVDRLASGIRGHDGSKEGMEARVKQLESELWQNLDARSQLSGSTDQGDLNRLDRLDREIAKTRAEIGNLLADLGKMEVEAQVAQTQAAQHQTERLRAAATERGRIADEENKKAMKALNEDIDRINESIAAKRNAFKQEGLDIEAKTKLLKLQTDVLQANENSQSAATQAVRDYRVQSELEKQIQKEGLILTQEEIDKRREQIAALVDQEIANKNVTEAIREQQEAAKQAQQQQAELAKELVKPWQEAAEGIRNAFVRTFEDVFESGRFSLGGLANLLKSSIAQLGATQVTNAIFGIPTSQGTVGGIFSGGGGAANLTSSIGLLTGMGSSVGTKFAMSGLGQTLGLSKTVEAMGIPNAGVSLTGSGEFIANGINGAPWGILGSVGANLIGLKGSGNVFADMALQTGGAIAGAGLGATIASLGSLGSLGGPIGAVVGAFLGTALGSLFRKKPSDKLQGAWLDPETGEIDKRYGYSGKKYSQENADEVTAFSTQLSKLIETFNKQTGGKVNGGSVRFESGDLTGYVGYIGDDVIKSGNVDEIYAAMVDRLFKSATGVSEKVATALEHLDFKADLQGAVNKLDLVTGYEKLLDQLNATVEPVTAVQQAIAQIDAFEKQILDLKPTFQELGLTVDEALAKIAEGRDNLKKDYEAQLDGLLNDLNGKGYINQIRDVIAQRDTLIADAARLGADSSRVSQWFELTVKRIVEGAKLSGTALQELSTIFIDLPKSITEVVEVFDIAPYQAKLTDARAAYVVSLQSETQQLQQTANAFGGFVRQQQAFRQSLLLDSALSPLSTMDQYGLAQQQYSDVLQRALDGDQDANSQFVEIARTVATLSRAINASGAAYAADIARIQQDSLRLEAKAQAQVNYASASYSTLSAQLQTLQDIKQLLSVDDARTQYANAQQAVNGYAKADFDALNSEYYNAWQGSGLSADNFAKTATYKSFEDRLANLIGGASASAADYLKNEVLPFQLAQASDPNSPYQASGIRQAVAIGDVLHRLGVKGFATGGVAYGLSLVGEQGPELVDFRQTARVYSNSDSRRIISASNDNGGVIAAIKSQTELHSVGYNAIGDELRELRKENAQLREQFTALEKRLLSKQAS